MTIAQLHQSAQRDEPGTTARRRLCRGTVEGKRKQVRVYRQDLNEWALRNFRKEEAWQKKKCGASAKTPPHAQAAPAMELQTIIPR